MSDLTDDEYARLAAAIDDQRGEGYMAGRRISSSAPRPAGQDTGHRQTAAEVRGKSRCWDDEPDCNCGGYEPASGPRTLSPVDELLTAARQALWDTPRAQVLIARDLDISTKHLSMIRQRHADPSLDLLRRLCVLLDVPAADRDGYQWDREEMAREVRALAEVWSRSSEYRRVSHLGDRLLALLDGPDTGRRP